MMAREVTRAALRLGCLIALLSAAALLFLPTDSAEFAVSLLSALIGIALIGGGVALFRLSTGAWELPRARGDGDEPQRTQRTLRRGED